MSSAVLRIPITVEEQGGLARAPEWVRIGVPIPTGLLFDADAAEVRDAQGRLLPYQARALASWPDRSIKWLLVDTLVAVDAHARTRFYVGSRTNVAERVCAGESLVIEETATDFVIDTGAARFTACKRGPALFEAVRIGPRNLLRAPGPELILTARDGGRIAFKVARVALESRGPIVAQLLFEGVFEGLEDRLQCSVRSTFVAGSTAIRLEVLVRNPRPARHTGGLWDLGDPGSVYFEDLSLEVFPEVGEARLAWRVDQQSAVQHSGLPPWVLYQDSSGGENWRSQNHVSRTGQPSVSFRGYRVGADGESGSDPLTEGLRATPYAQVCGELGWVAVSCEHFWQNFPKALRWREGQLELGIFPAEAREPFELQGGEQKRHLLWMELGDPATRTTLPLLQSPVTVAPDPEWVESSGALPYFVAGADRLEPRYLDYISGIVAGANSFFARRELIDEYGWRNFGELYADHEAVRAHGPQPLVSHYNNQYDFIQGAVLHFLRTGDSRWYELLRDAVRHTIDIDIYHTTGDRPIFNGGLFWHTDHYEPAATCTHRTYSRLNARGRNYGGGLSNEHNYTTGLLYYHFLTGDAEAAAAVRGLAEWVIGMDDGAATVLALITESPTGLASKTVEMSYHKPGRGAGNSINALLDGYALSGERRFLEKAQEILQRCIHPRDPIAALQLDQPERRWSYLVFLQALGKYLGVKLEIGETDYAFRYARASLLHYARWMLAHEVPYKDALHKVEIPSETWPAHDVRKCHILHLAARYAEAGEREQFRSRAEFFFERCLTDLLSFPTSGLTRPLVILCVYGCVQGYYSRHDEPVALAQHVDPDFGTPSQFVPQSGQVAASVRRKLRLLSGELGRLARETLHAVRRKVVP